jgi:hypothetical protein
VLNWVELSLSYGRQSVDQFIMVSGSTLGPMTRFYPYPFFSDNIFVVLPVGRPLWREDGYVTVQSLTGQVTEANNHTLPSHLRLCSPFVASYDSQGLRWRYSNPPPHGVQLSLRCLTELHDMRTKWRERRHRSMHYSPWPTAVPRKQSPKYLLGRRLCGTQGHSRRCEEHNLLLGEHAVA